MDDTAVHARVAILAESIADPTGKQSWQAYAETVGDGALAEHPELARESVPTDIAAVASVVLDDPQSWLHEPIEAFGEVAPADLMRFAAGKDAVRAMLMAPPSPW